MVVLYTEEGLTAIPTENGMTGKGRQVFSHEDVHVYFIHPQEYGASKRDTTTVRLVIIPVEDQNAFSNVVIPPAFLEAGGWFYPLIPSKTPVYRTQEKYYIFPDLLSSPGASVGIVFSDNITSEKKDFFETILLNLAGLEKFPNDYADRFGNPGGLITVTDAAYAVSDNYYKQMATEFPNGSITELVGAGIMTAAGMAADEATKTLDFVIYETEQAQLIFNSNFDLAKEYTGKAVEISGHAVSRLADATSKLAEFSAHHIKSATSSAMETIQSQTVRGASAVCYGVNAATGGAMYTMEIVYESLHNAGITLAHAITNNHVLDNGYETEQPENKNIVELGPASLVTDPSTTATTEKSKTE